MDQLAIYQGFRLVGRVPVGAEPLTIGRDLSNRIVLDDAAASRVHARVTPREGRIYIVDPGSTNGTTVSGQRLPPGHHVELRPGDVLGIGHHRVVLERSEVPAGAPRRPGATVMLATLAGDLIGGALRDVQDQVATRSRLETLARQAGARLVVCQCTGPVAYDIVTPRVRVGRSADNDIVIDDPTVSQNQLEIALRGARFYVGDLRSTNKTRVDGTLVVKSALDNHAAIRVGEVPCLFESELPHRAGGERGEAEAVALDLYVTARTHAAVEERDEERQVLKRLFGVPLSPAEWRALPFYADARALAEKLEVEAQIP